MCAGWVATPVTRQCTDLGWLEEFEGSAIHARFIRGWNRSDSICGDIDYWPGRG